MRLTSGQTRVLCPKKLTGHNFIVKEKAGRGEELLCLFWIDVMFLSLAPPFTMGREFSCLHMVRLGPWIIVLYVHRACPNMLSYWSGCRYHATIDLFFGACLMSLLHGFVSKQALLVLWLSKLLFQVTAESYRTSHICLLTPLVGLTI